MSGRSSPTPHATTGEPTPAVSSTHLNPQDELVHGLGVTAGIGAATATAMSDMTPDKLPLSEKSAVLHDQGHDHPLAKLSNIKKNILLVIFAIATFLDICNASGAGIAVAQISVDIGIEASQIVWIITSYSIVFAAFLLFGGRLSDLFPAHLVFEAGFIGLGVMSLIVSFVTTNKYGFLILRGLAGLFGALTIPSSYHLVVHMYPDPTQQAAKLALISVSAALGNVLGLVIAGVMMLASYQWFFRLIAILCLAFAALAIFLLPWVNPAPAPPGVPKWRLLDIPGVVLMMGALLCFILSLTQGPIDGWNAASFIAPFILSFFLGVGFFVWESKIPPRTAILPSSIWKVANIIPGSIAILSGMSFFFSSQLQYSTWFQFVFGWTPIHTAAAILPQGIMSLLVGVAAQFFPAIISKPQYFIPIGTVLVVAAELLQIFSYGGAGYDYWRYVFPAYLLGAAGATFVFLASAINVINYCPPEMSGVSGAWAQVVAQVGAAIVLAVQAGFEGSGGGDSASLIGVVPGGLDKIVPAQILRDQWWHTAARTYFFQIAWVVVIAIQYVVLFREPGSIEEEHRKTRQRIEESGKDAGVSEV